MNHSFTHKKAIDFLNRRIAYLNGRIADGMRKNPHMNFEWDKEEVKVLHMAVDALAEKQSMQNDGA